MFGGYVGGLWGGKPVGGASRGDYISLAKSLINRRETCLPQSAPQAFLQGRIIWLFPANKPLDGIQLCLGVHTCLFKTDITLATTKEIT